MGKSSAPAIQAKGSDIGKLLFKKLFTRHEMFTQMFPDVNTESGKMISALPSALLDFAKNCDNMDAMGSTISRIASRHVTQGVQDWHYPIWHSASSRHSVKEWALILTLQ